MGFTPNLPLLLVVILALLPTQAYAFGAGDIPDFAYLNGMDPLHKRHANLSP